MDFIQSAYSQFHITSAYILSKTDVMSKVPALRYAHTGLVIMQKVGIYICGTTTKMDANKNVQELQDRDFKTCLTLLIPLIGPFIVQSDRAAIIKSMPDHPEALKEATPEMLKDIHFVSRALKENPAGFKFLDDKDKSIPAIMKAFSETLEKDSYDTVFGKGQPFQIFSKEVNKALCANEDFMKAVSKVSPQHLLLADPILKQSPDFIGKAFKENPELHQIIDNEEIKTTFLAACKKDDELVFLTIMNRDLISSIKKDHIINDIPKENVFKNPDYFLKLIDKNKNIINEMKTFWKDKVEDSRDRDMQNKAKLVMKYLENTSKYTLKVDLLTSDQVVDWENFESVIQRDDRKEAKQLMYSGKLFADLNEELRSDPNIINFAAGRERKADVYKAIPDHLKDEAFALKHLEFFDLFSPELKANKNIILARLSENLGSLRFDAIPDNLRGDREVLLAFIKTGNNSDSTWNGNTSNIKDFLKEYQKIKELDANAFLEDVYKLLPHNSDYPDDRVSTVFNEIGGVLKEDKSYILSHLKTQPSLISSIDPKILDVDFLKECIKANPECFKFITNVTDEKVFNEMLNQCFKNKILENHKSTSVNLDNIAKILHRSSPDLLKKPEMQMLICNYSQETKNAWCDNLYGMSWHRLIGDFNWPDDAFVKDMIKNQPDLIRSNPIVLNQFSDASILESLQKFGVSILSEIRKEDFNSPLVIKLLDSYPSSFNYLVRENMYPDDYASKLTELCLVNPKCVLEIKTFPWGSGFDFTKVAEKVYKQFTDGAIDLKTFNRIVGHFPIHIRDKLQNNETFPSDLRKKIQALKGWFE